ncbi:MAG TPA: 16S rRNA (cytosine(1402)-N(4))-methyltransferase RsmH [Polyangia bacterium]|nr:16S rRNA (cytosine(1402)-N(4))-methyltransferase RsmH [Polyangia bacterium]
MSDEFTHATVMPEETLELLAPRAGGVYCDATLGGGGHAERILRASEPDGRLIGIDRDPAALAAAGARLSPFGERVTLVHGTFGDARALLERLGVVPVDGFVLDLGVSSPQLDRGERGFSFRQPGPLDMRMDPTGGETAEALIRRIGVDELADILRRYGEERYAGRIARAIKEGVMQGAVTSTTELAALVARSVPTRERHKDPATRTFQALRIAVNDELGQLERFLADFPSLVRPGGRVVVIAFHSLEDGLVKNRFRDLAKESGYPPDIAAKMGLPPPVVKVLTRKPREASDAEVAANPRARSAKLRAAELR